MTTGMRRLFDANLIMWLMVTGVTMNDPTKAQYVAWPCVFLAALAQHWAYYKAKRERAAVADAARVSAAR